MTTQGKFWQRVYGWGLLSGLALLWLLMFNTGRSLAQTPTPTATPLLLPRQSADLLRVQVDTQTAAAAAAAQLQAQSDGALQVDYNPTTGAARWVTTEGTALTQQFAGRNLNPEAAARAFFGAYGRLFGVADQAAELQLTQLKRDQLGGQHVAFQQQQAGIKVFGADLKVHLDGTGAVKLINGYTLPTARGLSLTPTLSPDQAAQAAVRTTGLADGVVSSNTLVILNPGLITDQASPTYLTYQVRVDSAAQPDAAVWLFIDAATGEVRFSYPAVTDARNRNTYNAQGGTSGGTLARNETAPTVTSAPNCSVNDINRVHDYTGQIYDFYFNRFGRDSYDGAGAALNSYACYGVNYKNAMWTGSYMVYGAGYALDDVVGHELSHGVTQYISGLIYSGQSGALNESFSDIMGEVLDFTNNSGNDASTVRWYIGEELPGGALRDMMYPLRFNQPDRTDSSSFDCSTQEVHKNSGVQNKAFALMVDGGTFNRYTIAPLGLDKAVAIIYRANDLYLTASAKFLDAYNAINRSCTELYGAGSADCTNVKKALDATRMSGSICGVGGVPQPTPPNPPLVSLVNGDFEAGPNVGWSETNNQNRPLITTGYAQSGDWKALLGGANNNTSAIAQSYSVSASGGTLTYAYRIASSDTCGYDFAYVEVNNTILQTYDLCLGSSTSLYNRRGSVYLDAYAGQTVTIRFRVTTDSGVSSNFYLDDVAVTDTLIPPTATPSPTPTVPPTPTPIPLPPAYPVVVWGYNATGQSTVPPGLQSMAVAGGYDHSLALKNDGTVVAWGSNSRGQISVPAGLSGVKAIGAGYYHSLAVKADGTVVAWGCAGFNYSQCFVPPNLTGATSVTGGYFHSLALKSDGTVVAWGCGMNYEQCKVPTGLKDVVAIAAGELHSLALKRDGTVVTWGCSGADYGQCTVPAGLSGVKAIAANGYHNLALKNDGTVVAWGCGSTKNAGQCVVPAGLSGVVAIAAGLAHSLALKSDGTLVAWGCIAADAGQCKIPTGVSGVIAMSAGAGHNLVLTSGAAGGAGFAADTSAVVTGTLPALAALPPITSSVPVSGPVIVTATVVAEAPPVTTPQPVTTGDAGAAPTAQSQRLFLPLVANNVAVAAPLASAGATGAQNSVVDATVVTTTTLPAVDPGVMAPTEPLSTTAAAAAAPVTATEPVSVPAPVAAAPDVVEATPVISAAPAVTTTQPLTPGVVELAPANPLAGTAVGSPSGLALLALAVVVVVAITWQRRRVKR